MALCFVYLCLLLPLMNADNALTAAAAVAAKASVNQSIPNVRKVLSVNRSLRAIYV